MSEQINEKKHFTVALIANSSIKGGAEQYLYDLYRELKERDAWKVVLVGSLPNWPPELGVQISTGKPRKFTRRLPILLQVFQSLYYPFRVRKIVRKLKPDLIHMQFMREKLLLPALLSKYCKVMWTEHGPLPDDFSNIPLAVFKWQSKHSTIISISSGVKESLNFHGIDSFHIPNPIPNIPSDLSIEKVRESFASTERFRALYLGRIHKNKRLELLIEVAKFLPKVDFFIAGEGEYQENLLNQAPKNVTFLGFVQDVKSLIYSANVLVMTSGKSAREGSPLVMLDARSLGIPVLVASDSHAATEAESLGCYKFQPNVNDLLAELSAIINDYKFQPLDEKIRAERTFLNWSTQHSLFMHGLLKK
jgi:glycosyltransferase involved in cell wall biosynthesis